LLIEKIDPAALAGANGVGAIEYDNRRYSKVGISSQAKADLISELNAARDRLDARVALLNRALDLGEQLSWDLLDLDDARSMVAELRRDSTRVRP
jgi:hypothetical protein